MMLTYGFKYCGRVILSDVCRGRTPLHQAMGFNIDNGEFHVASEFLLKSGADVNAKDNE